MNFTQTEPDEAYPIKRMVSESGSWEFGIRAMIFGYRVAAGVVGEQTYSIDYCCAADGVWLIRVAATVLAILEALPESTSSQEAEAIFPRQQSKPMVNDPECWEKLTALLDRVCQTEEACR